MTRSAEEIRDWLRTRVSNLTGVPPEQIDTQEPLLRLGLDSVGVVTLAADLENWVGYRFRENPLEQYPTIHALAEFLAAEEAKGQHPS
jgi:myxalamid-type polyketide synthase MxaB